MIRSDFRAHRLALVLMVLLSLMIFVGPTAAHGGGSHAPMPPGIIDPLVTHHAVLENEFMLNYSGTFSKDEGRLAHALTLEVAFAFTDWLGVEAFVDVGADFSEGGFHAGMGDVEIQFPKLSIVLQSGRTRGLVLSTYTAVIAPTGYLLSRVAPVGRGEPEWIVAPHLLMDLGVGNFGLQVNVAVEGSSNVLLASTLGFGVAVEGSFSVAYTFTIFEVHDVGAFVVSPLLEAAAEAAILGAGAGGVELSLIGGLKVALAGFHVGAGLQLPLAGDREFDLRWMALVGYHIDWEALF